MKWTPSHLSEKYSKPQGIDSITNMNYYATTIVHQHQTNTNQLFVILNKGVWICQTYCRILNYNSKATPLDLIQKNIDEK